MHIINEKPYPIPLYFVLFQVGVLEAQCTAAVNACLAALATAAPVLICCWWHTPKGGSHAQMIAAMLNACSRSGFHQRTLHTLTTCMRLITLHACSVLCCRHAQKTTPSQAAQTQGRCRPSVLRNTLIDLNVTR